MREARPIRSLGGPFLLACLAVAVQCPAQAATLPPPWFVEWERIHFLAVRLPLIALCGLVVGLLIFPWVTKPRFMRWWPCPRRTDAPPTLKGSAMSETPKLTITGSQVRLDITALLDAEQVAALVGELEKHGLAVKPVGEGPATLQQPRDFWVGRPHAVLAQDSTGDLWVVFVFEGKHCPGWDARRLSEVAPGGADELLSLMRRHAAGEVVISGWMRKASPEAAGA